MIKRIVEVSRAGTHLSITLGQLVVSQNREAWAGSVRGYRRAFGVAYGGVLYSCGIYGIAEIWGGDYFVRWALSAGGDDAASG